MPLSPEQLAAVRRSGQDACCVAGPGSGKTTVLVERFAWLVSEGLEPEKILAITFTEKAATQIKERLVRRFSDQPTHRRGVERSTVCTIHAFCMRLLGEHAVRAGLDPRFAVFDEQEARAEQATAMEAVLDLLAAHRRDEFLLLAAAWPAAEMASPLLSIYEDLRMAGGAKLALSKLAEFDVPSALGRLEEALREALAASPAATTEAQKKRVASLEDWLSQRNLLPPLDWLAALKLDRRGLKPGHPLYDLKDRADLLLLEAKGVVAGAEHWPHRALVREILIDFDAAYRDRKRAAARLDFGDLEEQALRLLERDPEVRAETQERYSAILMDELQDTNPVQWKILDLVRRPGRFFAVGDINQSIFGFRHAEPAQFAAYQEAVEKAGGTVDRLERNYRSRAEILSTVMDATVHQPLAGVRPHDLPAGRAYPPREGPVVELQRVEEPEQGNEEALWIARRLRELHGALLVGDPPRPARYSDMAVLARSKGPFEALEESFALYGIPCVIDRGRNFFDEPEIVDLTNALRVLRNPADEIPLFGLLRSPLLGATDDEIAAERAAGGLAPAWARAQLDRLRRFREELPTDLLLARWMDETGYLLALSSRARANVDKLLRLARSSASLEELITRIDDLRAVGRETNAPELESGEAVQILTVHQSKGLEFPVVVVSALDREPRGRSEPVLLARRAGLGLKWRLGDSVDSVADAVYLAALSERTAREKEEEGRLLYVAMTRAEERLILSWTLKKRISGTSWAAHLERALQPNWDTGEGPLLLARRTGRPALLEPAAVERASSEVVELDPLPRLRQASAAVTATAAAAFLDCPRRYFLQNLVGWPQPRHEAAGSGGARLGTEVHELLGGLAAPDEVSEEARALASVFEESDLGARARRARRVEREMAFLVELEGTLVRGQIDLWFEEEDGGWVVVDYKTDRSLDELRLASYEVQLGLYAAALGPRVKEMWLFGVRHAHPHPVPLARSDDARQLLRTLAAAELAGEFTPVPAPRCEWCPFARGACDADF